MKYLKLYESFIKITNESHNTELIELGSEFMKKANIITDKYLKQTKDCLLYLTDYGFDLQINHRPDYDITTLYCILKISLHNISNITEVTDSLKRSLDKIEDNTDSKIDLNTLEIVFKGNSTITLVINNRQKNLDELLSYCHDTFNYNSKNGYDHHDTLLIKFDII